MDIQDTTLLIELFENSLGWYSAENVSAFLKACWFIGSETYLEVCSLSRMIYLEGNRQEIYTTRERNFISNFEQEIFYCDYQKSSSQGHIDCKVISVNMENSGNLLYDSLAFMKIFNKAHSSFNVFIFATTRGIHFGCSCIKQSSMQRDCLISPLLTPDINWETFYNLLLYRDNSEDFYFHYAGVISFIWSLEECFVFDPEELYYTGSYENDVLYEDLRRHEWYDYDGNVRPNLREVVLSEWFGSALISTKEEDVSTIDIEEFDREVVSCMNDLEFIVSSKVNPLEMLFEAQRTMEHSLAAESLEQQEMGESEYLDSTSKEDIDNFALLDDPIALMKKLKTEQMRQI